MAGPAAIGGPAGARPTQDRQQSALEGGGPLYDHLDMRNSSTVKRSSLVRSQWVFMGPEEFLASSLSPPPSSGVSINPQGDQGPDKGIDPRVPREYNMGKAEKSEKSHFFLMEPSESCRSCWFAGAPVPGTSSRQRAYRPPDRTGSRRCKSSLGLKKGSSFDEDRPQIGRTRMHQGLVNFSIPSVLPTGHQGVDWQPGQNAEHGARTIQVCSMETATGKAEVATR